MNFAVLYHELINSAEVIHQLVNGLSLEEACLRPEPDAWCALEVICHLYDEEREDFRQHLDIILHHPEFPWPSINPGAWVTERNYIKQDLTEMVDKFLMERAESLKWLNSLKTADWDTEYRNEFGAMKAGDMLAAWVAHDNLHIRQLVALRRARLLTIAKPYSVEYAGDW